MKIWTHSFQQPETQYHSKQIVHELTFVYKLLLFQG